jgi:hypothetical protein
MRFNFLLILLLLLFRSTLDAQSQNTELQSFKGQKTQAVFLGNIGPLRDLPPHTAIAAGPEKRVRRSQFFSKNPQKHAGALPGGADPLAEKQTPPIPDAGNEITPLLNFEGIGDLGGITPPDPSGDIGKDHYVQMVNHSNGAWFQVWDKQGNSVYGPALTSTIWSQVQSGSIGDPIIQYDHAAQRWLMMEMQGFFVNELLVAISDDSDPTGSWKAYRFQTSGFPDYPKLYVWPNAYLVTANEIIGGNTCSAYALNRNAMLAGNGIVDIYRFEMPNFSGIDYQPATGADWEGGPPPPPGSPGYIFRVYDDAWNGGQDQLQIWEIFVDWQNPDQNKIEGPKQIFPAPFETAVCVSGLFDCIEQPGNGSLRITALDDIIMYRVPYRNFGSYESVVLNHVADVSGQVGPGGDAAVRWYELRKSSGGNWQIHQQGTYAPDLATNRFMGTLCMDGAGNIGLGYSVCSEQLFPGLRITGRRAGDLLNQMPLQEYEMAPGGKSHESNRWGDYSAMAVDPEDERTFWFTGEYQPDNVFWATRIAAFRIQRDTYEITPVSLERPLPSVALGANETVQVNVLNSGIANAGPFALSLYVDNNFVVRDTANSVFSTGSNYTHTFSKTVNMEVPGRSYNFMVITHWARDQFAKNDTLRVVVRKPTENDAQALGKEDFQGLICGSTYTFPFILRNASGLPMQSATINWRVNAQPVQQVQWSGNLNPGEQDTIPLNLSGILNGQNFFTLFTALPNGQPDQNIRNDSMSFKFFGNLNGAYLIAQSRTDFGILNWELRNTNNALIASGTTPPGNAEVDICAGNNTCYKLIVRSQTLNWKGDFKVLDIFGNVLGSLNFANLEPQVLEFCTPSRKSRDVGPFDLIAPLTGFNLGNNEQISVRYRNFGTNPVDNIPVAYRLNGGPWQEDTIIGTLNQGLFAINTFDSKEDLSAFGTPYVFDLKTNLSGDLESNNDLQTVVVNRKRERDAVLRDLSFFGNCDDINSTLIYRIGNTGLKTLFPIVVESRVNGAVLVRDTFFDPLFPEQEMLAVSTKLVGFNSGENVVESRILRVDPDGADDFSGNDEFTRIIKAGAGLVRVQVNLTSDDLPGTVGWELRDSEGALLAQNSNTPDVLGGVSWNTFCLPDSCFSFRILDLDGDGIVKTYVEVIVNNQIYFADNINGQKLDADLQFCLGKTCITGMQFSSLVYPDNSSTPAPDGIIEVYPQSILGPFVFTIPELNKTQDSPIFTDVPAGVYTVEVNEGGNNCIQKATVVVPGLSATTYVNGRVTDIRVSPNPASDWIWVDAPAGTGEYEAWVSLYDRQGKLLEYTRMARWGERMRGVMLVRHLPAGAYSLQVRTAAGTGSSIFIKK